VNERWQFWRFRLDPVVVDWIAFGAGIALPLAVAGALVPLRSHLPNATVALGLGLTVVVVAALGRRIAAGTAAVAASICFDVFFTRPYGSLAITRGVDVQTAVLLLVVGGVVGQLASGARRNRSAAVTATVDLARIHEISEMVAEGVPAAEVVIAVARQLTDLLHLRDCRFDPHVAEKPGPFVERNGAVTWGRLRWGTRSMGLPTDEVTLVVQSQGRPLGRYVLLATAGVPVNRNQLVAAVALADQAGAALTAQGVSVTDW
jgi:hypothetical protein